MHELRIGCSGWNYAHWRNGVFYPPRCASRHWLEFYARQFDTVEVNTTFYRLPRETSVARWVAETPPGFTFAVKVSRFVTHIKAGDRADELALDVSGERGRNAVGIDQRIAKTFRLQKDLV